MMAWSTCAECFRIVLELTKQEGDYVTILSAPGELTPYNYGIDCCGEWTGWEERRFTGDTMLAVLRSANEERVRIYKQ